MADKSTSPFAGLDKALLRSTKQSPPPPPQKHVEQDTAKDSKPDTAIPRHHDTAVATMTPRNQDTVVSDAEETSSMWYAKPSARSAKKQRPTVSP